MGNGPLVANRRVLVFGLASALLLMIFVTAQVAFASPSAGPLGEHGTASTISHTPTPEATDTPVPAPTPMATVAPPPVPIATPTPEPTSTPVPGTTPEPDVAPPVTQAYNYEEEAVFEIPVFEPEPTAIPEPTATPNPDATATPTPEPGATATPTPAPTATATPQPKVALKIPAKSMKLNGQPATGQITVKPMKASEAAAVTVATVPDRPGLSFAGRSVEINVFGGSGTSGAAADITDDVTFNPPLEIGFDITEQEWQDAGGDIHAFEVRFYSTRDERWVKLSGIVDVFSTPKRVTARVTHLTRFALFYERAEQGAGAPDGGDYTLGMGGAGFMALFGATLLITGFYVRRRANSAS